MSEGVKLHDGTTDELAARAEPDAPGDTALERGYMTVLRHSRKVAS